MTQSQYRSNRCIAVAASTGARCRLRTARGRKCWHHTKRDDNLRVKDSGIPGAGLGLFADREPIKRGARVTTYTGQDLTRAQVQRRYKGERGEYVLCRSKNSCRDSRRTDEPGLGRWVNDARGTGKRPNARLTRAYTVKATKNIPPFSQILVSYGRGYWKK